MIKKTRENEPLSIRANSIWNISGSLVHSFTQWGILIVIAKLGTPEMVGIFTLALALTAPLVLFFRFNLRSVVATDSNNDFSFNYYYTLSVLSTIIFITITIIISLFYLPNWELFFVIIIFSLAKAVESISEVLYGKIQKHERFDIIAKSRILKGVISLFIFSIVMFFSRNLPLAISTYFFSWLLILIIYDYPKTSKFGGFSFEFNKQKLKYLFLLSIPLGFAQLISSLNMNIPRYLLEYFHDPIVLGFFGAIIYIIIAGNNFVMAISGAILPKLSSYYFKGKIKEFLKILSGFLLLVIVFSLLGLIIVKLFGKEILTLVYTSEYAGYNNEFFYFLLLGFIMYSTQVFGAGLTSTRVFKVQPYINVVTLIVIVVTSYFLIPNNGIRGAVYSLMIGQSIHLSVTIIVLMILLKKSTKYKTPL